MRKGAALIGLLLSFLPRGTLGADDLILDPRPLKELLAPEDEFFLPGRGGIAPRKALMGDVLSVAGGVSLSSHYYFDYSRGTLVLDGEGRPSGLTLVRLFLDSRGERIRIPPRQESAEAEMLRPFLGGTLIFSRFKPREVALITRSKGIIPLEDSPGFFTALFETGGGFFWLGGDGRLLSYDREGRILSVRDFDSARMSFGGSRGELCLVDDQGFISFLSPREGEERERVLTPEGLFLSQQEEAEILMEESYPFLVEPYISWSYRLVADLYRRNPLNRDLGELERRLEGLSGR